MKELVAPAIPTSPLVHRSMIAIASTGAIVALKSMGFVETPSFVPVAGYFGDGRLYAGALCSGRGRIIHSRDSP
jgi:hypothetical protein